MAPAGRKPKLLASDWFTCNSHISPAQAAEPELPAVKPRGSWLLTEIRSHKQRKKEDEFMKHQYQGGSKSSRNTEIKHAAPMPYLQRIRVWDPSILCDFDLEAIFFPSTTGLIEHRLHAHLFGSCHTLHEPFGWRSQGKLCYNLCVTCHELLMVSIGEVQDLLWNSCMFCKAVPGMQS